MRGVEEEGQMVRDEIREAVLICGYAKSDEVVDVGEGVFGGAPETV